jgi:hypothetical protein
LEKHGVEVVTNCHPILRRTLSHPPLDREPTLSHIPPAVHFIGNESFCHITDRSTARLLSLVRLFEYQIVGGF